MSGPQYRALRVVLGFLSLLMAIGGVVLIFSSRLLILRLFLHPPEAEISTLLLATLKEMGGSALMLGIMLFFASRDPERNVAMINALTVGLCVLAVTPLISLYSLDVGRLCLPKIPSGPSNTIQSPCNNVTCFVVPKSPTSERRSGCC